MNDETPHVLVVDDDERLRNLLRKYLSDNGFIVTTAADATQARARLVSIEFDLLVLDLMMPGETGLELAADLRRTNNVPILMLTAMSEPEDRIAGLEHGADDYLTKPFEPRELVLRLHSILRRAQQQSGGTSLVHLGSYVFDAGRGDLRMDGQPVKLTASEIDLLRALVRAGGAPLAREDLAKATGTGGGDRSIDVQVNRLRRKIEPDPKMPRYLQTVRGKGYVLQAD